MIYDNIRTIRHAIEAFRSFLEDRSGRVSSDFAYPPKLIYYFLKMFRNRVSYEDITSKSQYDLNIELTIPCVSLKKADMVECPCAPASGCEFLKSVHPLPKMLNGIPNSVTLLKKGPTNNYGIFTYVDWYVFEDKINSRIPGQAKQLYYTVKNINSRRHLYVYANVEKYKDLQSVTVAGIFNDPLEVAKFPICGEKEPLLCAPLDEEFIIEDEIQSRVFELTYNALMGFKGAALGSDVLNNDNNEANG